MAKPKHLDILREGVDRWNEWRIANPNIMIDLMAADLSGVHLMAADLSRANLSRAHLLVADLYGANLMAADLSEANLGGAILYGANLMAADLSRANLSGADLREAYLCGADLSRANLSAADLREAHLCGVISDSGNPGPPQTSPAGNADIEVVIVLTQENIDYLALKRLQTALGTLMEAAEYELKRREREPVIGSRLQTLIFGRKDGASAILVHDILKNIKEAFIVKCSGDAPPSNTSEMMDPVAGVIAALEPCDSGVIRIGQLLVVKVTRDGKTILRVETLSPTLARRISNNPNFLLRPEQVWKTIDVEVEASKWGKWGTLESGSTNF